MRSMVPVLAFCAAFVAVGSATAAPSIGGDPIHTQDDVFTGGGLWSVNVSSYVFDETSDLPTGFVLGAGEMLFAYLLDGDDAFAVSVNTFTVGNPNQSVISSVGFSTDITPAGFDAGDREDPFLFGYSGPAQASVFTYAGDLADPFSTLEPTEWSLVWYIAESSDWALGPGSASGGGLPDTHLLPVPIPAPGALTLLGVAGLLGFGWRRRR
ncbi:MAG: PEP-CTERM sorting domain-containing protein [Phycisphaerales bacterium]|nr:PEP-CTERM sorting domain-containing protein [Phycisphaerales bacterium]NNM27622.1 PEP-CTERM sorting domain-containing protein [Phycisphaerales bacterium]